MSLSPSSPAYWQSTCPASLGQRPDCFPLAASSWCLSPQVTRSGLVGKPVRGQPACSRERRPSSLTRPRLAQPYSTLLPLRCPGALLRATWQGFLSQEKLTLLRFLLFGEWLTLVGLQGALLLSSTSVEQSQTSTMCVFWCFLLYFLLYHAFPALRLQKPHTKSLDTDLLFILEWTLISLSIT